MQHHLPRQVILRALLLLEIAVMAPPSVAQTNPAASQTRTEASTPQALRAKKGTIEAELAGLRSDLSQKKREMDEVRLLELDISGTAANVESRGAGIVEDIARTPEAIRRELRHRAQAALRDDIFPIDTERFQTFSAKQLAVRLIQAAAKARGQVPKECDASLPAPQTRVADLNRIVDACVAAVKAILDERKKNPAQGPQQEVNTVKTGLATEIESLTKRISASEASLREVDELLATSNDLTEIIIKWTIPSLGAVLVLILVAPRLYEVELQKEIVGQKLTLDLLTVYILVSTILILGLANRIQSEVLGTLIGGISGYVLGRSIASRSASVGPKKAGDA